jgi:hypothetical protein
MDQQLFHHLTIVRPLNYSVSLEDITQKFDWVLIKGWALQIFRI